MKKLASVLIVLLAQYSWAVPPVVTPSTPTVYVSSCTTLTSNQNVTFSLTSGSTGTLTGATANTVSYCAPGPLVAKNVWLGCPQGPQDSVYNTRIDALPVQVSSTNYLRAQAGSANIALEVDLPENRYTTATASTSLIFANSGINGYYKTLPFPDMRVENGFFTDSQRVDQHILGMITDTCQASELYKLYPIGYVGSGSCSICNSGSGVVYPNDYMMPQGVDAAGMPIARLALRYSELRDCINSGGAKPIKHALRMTASIGILSNHHIWPAVAEATDGGQLPFGARGRLVSTFTVTGSMGAQCIQTALKNYGFFFNDGGINGHIQSMQDVVADSDTFVMVTQELLGISTLKLNNVDIVDESSLMINSLSSQVNPTNGFVTPESFAFVIASNTATHEFSTMTVIVQPVTIGTAQRTGYSFMAGTPAQQLDVWVNGSTDTVFTCSMSPTVGSLTSGGSYTAPTSVVSRSSTTVTCSSRMDSNTSVSFPVVVYSSSAIRERLSTVTFADYGPDVNGNTWFSDYSSLYRFQGSANCDFTGDPWSGVTDADLYKHCEYVNSGSGDQYYRFFVPNGTYRIQLRYAIGGGSPFTSGTWQEAIDSQGSVFSSSPSTTTLAGDGPWTQQGITGKYFDLCTLIPGCAQQTPASITFSKTVTNNQLYFSIRHLAPVVVSQPASVLTAFSIEASTASFSSVNFGQQSMFGTGSFK